MRDTGKFITETLCVLICSNLFLFFFAEQVVQLKKEANGFFFDRLQLEHTGRRILEKTLQWALRNDAASNVIPFDTMSDVRVLESL